MKKSNITGILTVKTKIRSGFRGVRRSICAIFCVALLLGTFVGCTSYASTDEVSALQGRLDNTLKEIDSVKEAYEAAEQDSALLKSALESAEAELEALRTELENTKKNLENTKGALELIEGNNKLAEQKIDSLNKANDTARQELEALKSSYSSAQQEIDTLRETIDAAQDEISALKNNYDEAQREIDRLKAQIDNMQSDTPEGDKTEKIKIYIDQGHNPTSYHNAGSSGNGLYEQDLTFNIGILLAELLENDGRFEVCLSRPTADTVLGTNNDSSLDARVQGAKDFGADYFISLHINSFSDGAANGIEVHTAEQSGESYDFGKSLLQGLVDSTALRNRGMKSSPELRVLKNATMPAALLEMGFISNADDSALLDEAPELFAEGIYNGILDFFESESNDISY